MRVDLGFNFSEFLIICLIEFDLLTVEGSHLFFHGMESFSNVRFGLIEELSLGLIEFS